jgi:hypothetical protein
MPAACEHVSGGRRFSAGFGEQAAIDAVGLFLDKPNPLTVIHYSM